MTNQEAVKLIEDIRGDTADTEGGREYYEALSMAIDALAYQHVKDATSQNLARPNNDNISRQAAIGALNCDINIEGKDNAEKVVETIGTFMDRIMSLPSTDKHGAWLYTYPHMRSVEEQRFLGEKNPKGPIPDKRFPVMVCSLCGGRHPGDEDKFCPNCGALMDGVRKEKDK